MKFFFNHYSFSLLETKEECKVLLIDLINALDLLDSKIKLENFDFFVEVESFWNLLLIEGLTLEKLLEELGRDVESFFIDFISRSNKIENLFSLDNYLEMIPSYDIHLKNDGKSEQYYLLSLSYDLDGLLLSVNKNIWNKSLVKVWKVNPPNYEQVELKNIASKLHSLEFINIRNNEIKEEIISKLPQNSIIYSDSFKDWLLSINTVHRDKTIEKIQFVASKYFEGRRENGIAPITTDKMEHLKEIIVGSAGGLSYAQIRVLFKPYDKKYLILNGFIKQNESDQDKKYDEQIDIAKNVFQDIIKDNK